MYMLNFDHSSDTICLNRSRIKKSLTLHQAAEFQNFFKQVKTLFTNLDKEQAHVILD